MLTYETLRSCSALESSWRYASGGSIYQSPPEDGDPSSASQLLRDHQVTDPRDKGHAIVSISEQFQGASLSTKISMNYTRTVQDVFIDATRFKVESLTLDVLCLKELLLSLDSLPSWVVVKLLLEQGAELELNIKDNFGRSPLCRARRTGHPYIADLLEKCKENSIIFQEDNLPITIISVLSNDDSDVAMFMN